MMRNAIPLVGLPASVVPTAIIRKDLRLRMRGWRWAGIVTLYVGILGLTAVGFLLQKYSPSPSQSTQTGIDLFQTLAIFQLFLITFVTPASVAGAISGERQHRTWDLLIASRLSTRDIVWGKLLGGITFNLLLIAASLPLYGLVFLFGGVGLTDVFPVLAVFLLTVLLLGAVSLVVSALTVRLTVSYMLSMLIALTLTIGISALTLYLQSPGQLGMVTVAGVPFQSITQQPLTPLAQIDPLVALLSALPSTSGGTMLGGLGTVSHAFGLPWQLPLWGAYGVLSAVMSLLLILAASQLAVRPKRSSYTGRREE